MPFTAEQFIKDSLTLHKANMIAIDVADIIFSEDVRKYCEMNSCGKFGSNWACPPGVGPVRELKERVLKYKQGFLVQTVHQLKSSFDLKGMQAGKKVHEQILRNLLQIAKDKYGITEALLLGAGHCSLCKECMYTMEEPCRFPEKALASLEAYGVDVIKLTKHYDIPYHHGTGTVSYVGLVLLRK